MGYKKLTANIEGRVQGVGYRFYAQRNAQLLNITGWVKNLADGSVQVEAIGSEHQIQQFLQALRKGPALSIISNITHRIEDVEYNEYSFFDIRY